jgi:hypothetical protein
VKTTENKHTQGSAELSGVTLEKPRERRLTPPVGSSGVSLLEVLLDGLLGVLPLSGLLESLGRDPIRSRARERIGWGAGGRS